MKVLLVNSFCGFGSTGRICTDLYEISSQRGHETIIAYGREPFNNDSRINIYKIGNKLSVYNHVFQTRLFDRHGFASKISTLLFLNFVRKYQPDVIHLHNLHGYYINYPILFKFLSKEYKGKIVWTLHDEWILSMHGAYIDNVEADKRSRVLLREYPKAYFRLWNNLKQKKKFFTSTNQLTIVSPSKWLSNILETSYLGGYDIRTINNGIDLKKFFPDFKNKLKSNKLILLFVASIWEERKGYEEIKKLISILGNEKYEFVIIGELEKQIEKIRNAVHISRTSDISELREWYSKAYCFINLTLADNFPTTNIEALACGTPVITYDSGGSGEAIEESVGCVIKRGDLNSVVKALDEKIPLISREQCVAIAHNYDKWDSFKKYVDIYEEG